jgi:hypothetical protein
MKNTGEKSSQQNTNKLKAHINKHNIPYTKMVTTDREKAFDKHSFMIKTLKN